jgi:hypothetical protein
MKIQCIKIDETLKKWDLVSFEIVSFVQKRKEAKRGEEDEEKKERKERKILEILYFLKV